MPGLCAPMGFLNRTEGIIHKMSAKASFWAWEQTGLTGIEKLVLLCLADAHNDESRRSWYSYSKMAEKCCVSRQTVIRACKKLQSENYLSIIKRKDEGNPDLNTTNYFYLNVQVTASKPSNSVIPPEGKLIGGVVSESYQGSIRELPKPKREPKRFKRIDSDESVRAITDKKVTKDKSFDEERFEQFWKGLTSLYKTIGSNAGSKSKARTSFKRAKINPDKQKEIFALAQNQVARKVEIQKAEGWAANMAHISTWLNNKGWEDEVDILGSTAKPKSNTAMPPSLLGMFPGIGLGD